MENRAKTLFEQGLKYLSEERLHMALDSFSAALKADPTRLSILYNLATTHIKLGDYDSAESILTQTIGINSQIPAVWHSLGLCKKQAKLLTEAEACFRRVLNIEPKNFEATVNLGICLRDQGKFKNALEIYSSAEYIRPDIPEIFFNKADCLEKLGELGSAIELYKKAIMLRADYADALFNLGRIYSEYSNIVDYKTALYYWDRLLRIEPNRSFLLGAMQHLRMHACQWTDFDTYLTTIRSQISHGGLPSSLFPVLGLFDEPELVQRTALRVAAARISPIGSTQTFPAQASFQNKLRVAFISADFRPHPMAYNFRGFFRSQRKLNLETFAISFGPPDSSGLKNELKEYFDHFLEVEHMSDQDVVKLVRQKRVDIAVDMMGSTKFSRPDIFVTRAAPIQVNLFGWQSDNSALDFMIADNILVLPDYRQFYPGYIAYLPSSYFAFDNQFQPPNIDSKEFLEKFKGKFVFCCFNNLFKITPMIFTTWCNILTRVPESVLWLRADDDNAKNNLRHEASKRGLDSSRLVFAPRLNNYESHLTRYRYSNLFLDTFPFTGQTTCTDALRQGLPVITLTGRTTMARMATSILTYAGLGEFCCQTIVEYENRAVDLALNPKSLELAQKLLRQVRNSSLFFDSDAYARFCGSAFSVMREQYARGEGFNDFCIRI